VSIAFAQPLPLIAFGRDGQQESWLASPFDVGYSTAATTARVDAAALGSSGQMCASGFDSLGFFMATTSAVNDPNAVAWSSPSSPDYQLRAALNDAQARCGLVTGNTAAAVLTSPLSSSPLPLVRGAAGASLDPLLDAARAVDTVVVVDAAADGAALVEAAQRACALQPDRACSDIAPTLPAASGFNTSTTFFGCNSTAPLIVYMPGPSPLESTLGSITPSDSDRLMDAAQARALAGRGPAAATPVADGEVYTLPADPTDPLFAGCVACAAVDRSRAREGLDRTPDCVRCFERYCWTPPMLPTSSAIQASVFAREVGSIRGAVRHALRSVSIL